MATRMPVNIQKFTSSPKGVALLYFNTRDRIVPSTPPISGPTYGMMFRMPVRNAMPMAALNPIRAMNISPRKLSSATPTTSMSTPIK